MIVKAAYILAQASGGNPAISTLVILIFWIWFNTLEASVERLFFGERFAHWLDPVFGVMFISFAALTVYACAHINR